MNRKHLSIVTLLAVAAAAPGLAAADHRRDAGWLQLAEIGTHAHDAEDFVQVDPRLRVERVQLRATEGFIPIDGLRVHFTDGRTVYTDVRRALRDGQAILVDLPAGGRIDMLTIDYGNRGPYWRARQTARLEVLAQSSGRFGDRDRYRGDGRYRDHGDYRDYRTDDVRYRERVRVQPYVGPSPAAGFELRGGVQVRLP